MLALVSFTLPLPRYSDVNLDFRFQGRVPWNLAGLVGHLQPDSGSGLTHYAPHYPAANSGSGTPQGKVVHH
jgi:hypothetical protein